MTSSNSATASKQRPVLAAGAHTRWYIFATVSLACFFIAVTLWQRPPKSYTAKIDIHQTGHHGQLDDRDAIVASIFKTHDEHAHHHHHGDHAHGHSHTASHEVGEQPHLLVDVVTFEGDKQVSIWCACRSAEAALAEAEMLAEAYIARVDASVKLAPVRSDKADLNDAVNATTVRFEQAQKALADFEERHAAALAAGDGADETPPPEEIQPAAIAEPNPKWIEANERLATLQTARNELLQDKTFQHPAVRDLQWQIESIEAELAKMPRSVVQQSPVNHVDQPQPQPEGLTAELEQQHIELQRAVATAQAHLAEVETAAQQATKAVAEVPKTTAVATIDGPARIVSTSGAGASLSGVVGGALIALLVGMLVASRSLVVKEPSTFVSLQRVAALGIPVAASLNTGDGPELAPPQSVNPSWIAWLTFACELLIAATALLLVLSALADWQFAAHLVRNPLSALTDAANRLW